MEEERLRALTALAHPARMAVFRLLMRRVPDALPAGEISAALGLKPSTASVHLAALLGAGLLRHRRQGTQRLYAIDLDGVRVFLEDLVLDACRGRADLALALHGDILGRRPTMSDTKYKVLFICTGNSARSIFAESLLRAEAGDRFEAYSAGTRPQSELNPFALEVLEHKGHDITPLRAKNVQEFQGPDAPRFDFVFTVCNRAANEEWPAWAGQPISSHWGMPDPVQAEGTDAEKSLAFQHAYGALRNRILAFTALPIASLDRISLQRAVDRIGEDDRTPA